MRTERLIVNNMKCMGCVNAVKTSVSTIHGVTGVYVDLSKNEVTVNFDDDDNILKEIIKKLDIVGYPVKN